MTISEAETAGIAVAATGRVEPRVLAVRIQVVEREIVGVVDAVLVLVEQHKDLRRAGAGEVGDSQGALVLGKA